MAGTGDARNTGAGPASRSPEADDLLPDLDLSSALLARPLGLGSLRHVLRLTLAVTVSWLIAEALSGSTFGLFAPVTTLLVVQSSPWTTLGLSVQRILGTGAGVLVASVWVNLVGLTWWSFLIGVGVSLLLARALPLSLGGQLQIPVAVVFVLALGPGSLAQDLWRVLDVLIGGAIGLLAVFIYPPKPRREPYESAVQAYRDAIIDVLAQVGAESGSHPDLVPGAWHDFVQPSRRLRERATAARDALVGYVDASRLNPRARGAEEYVSREAVRLRRLTGIAIQVRGIVGAANRFYDRPGIDPALSGAELHRLADDLVVLARCVLGEPGMPVSTTDDARASDLDRQLQEELRAAADGLVDRRGAVRDAFGSVTLLGRLDLVRIQLDEFAEWEA